MAKVGIFQYLTSAAATSSCVDSGFEAARTAAQGVLENENATQNEVDTVLATLNDTMTALATDTSVLDKVIQDAEKLNAADYTAGSYAVLEEKLEGAEALTKQSDIDTRVDEINAAINALVNIKELKEVVAEAAKKNESDYSEETWTTFEQAKVKAEAVLANNNATQDEVNAAKTELQTAMDALKADKKALTDIIAEAKALENTKADYTAGSYAKVIEALVGADELANDLDASQEDVNNKVKEIRDAIDGLVDLTDLKTIIAIADKKVVEEQGDYSDKTWEAFLAEKSAAEAVRDNQNASKQDVQEAITNLQAAIENLKADNSELLAIIIKTGTKEETSIDLANRILILVNDLN